MLWFIGLLIFGTILLWPLLNINKEFSEMEEYEEFIKHFEDKK